MARTYRHTPLLRIVNAVSTGLLERFGIGPRNAHAVTVRGRSSGKAYTTTMRVLTRPEARYLVSAFGETHTIKNLRAAGKTTLIRGGRREDIRLVELPVGERAPFIREYLRLNGRMGAYFGAKADSSDDTLAQAARDHTVFRIEAP